MSRYGKFGVCLCICVFLLAGCGQAKVADIVDAPTLSVTDEGEVTAYLVDVFDKDYYDITGLADMAVKEAAAYNTAHQTGEQACVTVEKVEALEDGSGKIVVTQKYETPEIFADYNDAEFFFGSVQEALDAGYDLNGDIFLSAKDGSTMTDEQFAKVIGKKVLITDQKLQIYCPHKVTHFSEGAAVNPDGSIDTTGVNENVYILMK